MCDNNIMVMVFFLRVVIFWEYILKYLCIKQHGIRDFLDNNSEKRQEMGVNWFR